MKNIDHLIFIENASINENSKNLFHSQEVNYDSIIWFFTILLFLNHITILNSFLIRRPANLISSLSKPRPYCFGSGLLFYTLLTQLPIYHYLSLRCSSRPSLPNLSEIVIRLLLPSFSNTSSDYFFIKYFIICNYFIHLLKH